MSTGKVAPARPGRQAANSGEAAGTGPPRGAWDETQVYDYDPEFFPAISRGSLTPAAASARGPRRVLIQRLVSEEKLAHALAVKVADGEMSIATARRLRAEAETAAATAAAAVPRRRRGIVAALAAGLGGAALFVTLGWFTQVFVSGQGSGSFPVGRRVAPLVLATATTPAAPVEADAAAPAVTAKTEIRRDDAGRVTEIRAPSAAAVLDSFVTTAAAGPGAVLVGVDDGPFPSGRICRGVYKVVKPDGETRYGLPIRWDPAAQVWLAGDGREPIQAKIVP